MRLHVIDGTYELFRAHYSKRPQHTTPDGRALKATVGLVASFLSLLHSEQEAVTHIAVAFDNPIRSFRNELFAGYKTGDGIDPELHAQFNEAEQATAALGIAVWPMARYEADDALATAAHRFAEQVDQVRIMSVDKDFGQCLVNPGVVLVDRRRELEYDAAAIIDKQGVAPQLIPDWLALVGDSADGIPGLPGFGKKSAARVLQHYGGLDRIPLQGEWEVKVRGAQRLQETLASRIDEALLYRRLATLVVDVPLPQQSIDELRWNGVPRGAFGEWCQRVGAGRLEGRPSRWADAES